MTPNDAQIDLLLKRHVRKAGSLAAPNEVSAPRHLEADELSAFAEGALPQAARARYVSHLADCDHCRKLATQLTMAAGMSAQSPVESDAAIVEKISLWQSFRNLFAPASLRYAAFALVAIAALGITFVVWRGQQENRLVAEKSPTANSAGSAVKAPNQAAPAPNQVSSTPQSATQSTNNQNSNLGKPAAQPGGAGTLSPTVAPAREVTEEKDAKIAASKTAEPEIAKVEPSFAPPPPGDHNEANLRKAEALNNAPPAPKNKQSNDDFRILDRNRTAGAGGLQENQRARSEQDQPNQNEIAGNRSRAPETSASARREARDKSNSQTQEQTRDQSATLSSVAPNEVRKAGGHTFRKEAGAWVDAKFKPSLAIVNVSRGSEEFRALDSGVRAIAEQLGGEVIVVHKGKAYRIR